MSEGLPRAAGPRPSGDLRRERGWRSGRRGSRPPAPDPASAQPGLDAGAVRAERRRDADRRWPARRARPGTRGPGHRAGRVRARRSGSSPRPPAGQRAVGLQGSDLGVQQLALEQHLAQLRLQALGLQRLAVGGPRDEAGLSSGDEGVLPSGQGRSRDAQCARKYLQVLTPQQAQDRITLALARHAPTPAQTNRARSCCLCRHRHPPADHVRLQGVSANRGAQHGILAGAAYTVHRSVKQYRLRYPHSSDVHGSATFLDRRAVPALTRSDGLIIGREIKPNGKPGKLLRDNGPAHLLSLAPTRSGKGVGAIIPNLLTADRSTVCTDPKGENARATYHARSRFGPVHVLDPFGITGLPAAAYNPLDGLDPSSLDLAEDAATIADALVHDPPGQVAEAHWNEEAKALLTGLILYAVCHEQPDDRTLATVRDYLSLNPENFRGLLKLMQDSTAAGGLIARAANRHLSKADREAAGVLSSAQRHTHFLDSPRMGAVMARSDFRFAQLKDRTASVFLVLPPDRLGTYSRWLRLMVAQAITDMARSPRPTVRPRAVPAR